MGTKIYVVTHKEYTKPDDDMYISLQVGKAIGADLGYLGDDTGDNISVKNKSYCELTGIYWLWKNICDVEDGYDNIGICHYRRYFVVNEGFMTNEYIDKVLEDYDIIVSESGLTQYESLYEHYDKIHIKSDLLLCRDVIKEKCPEYTEAFELCMNCNLFTLGNMMVTSKKIFKEYCEWLFPLLFELESRLDFSKYDDFQYRVMGYIAERLLRVWLINHEYRIKEEKVMLINPEDSENGVKTVELKYKYIDILLKDLTNTYKNNIFTDVCPWYEIKKDFNGKTPVWICWWQGIENAPEIVKLCFESIKKNMPENKTEIHLITFENMFEYITLPDWIIDKFNNGNISMTHLSDILRVQLLYRYGGLWLDATYFISEPIKEEFFGKDFYTIRLKESPRRADVTKGRWACNCMMTKEKNILFRYLLNGMYIYWLKEEKIMDSCLINYIIALAYDNMPDVNKIIKNCEYSQGKVFELQKILNKKHNSQRLNEVYKNTNMFKLSYKMQLKKEIITGEKTIYGYLLEG